ncbi:hypothetical protein B296_00026269 [Ensete ventricosum]|uniref:Trichome birefringence-like C-terminal domain-containing protein n=1 Tax=Ensete ventricosum TaxID=4639 RepID=A0A426YRQ6_ENSVE|nr:hypothetical protein B296_00026269 [Ensete ventricosum]
MGSSYTLSVSAKGGLSQSPLMPAANSRVIQLVQSPPDPELLSPNLSAPQPATAATISRVTPVVEKQHKVRTVHAILLQAETPRQVFRDSGDKYLTWYFPSHEFTLMVMRTEYFAEARPRIINGTASPRQGEHELDGETSRRRLRHPLRSVLRTALQFITTCKECEGLVTFLRTFTPSHFENGSWFSGGHCNRTQPLDESQISLSDITWEIRKVQLEEIERARRQDGEVNIKFDVLDVTKAMMLRADAHPGNHWTTKGSVNDCLPGPVDLWSDLLLATLEKSSLSHQLHTYLCVFVFA